MRNSPLVFMFVQLMVPLWLDLSSGVLVLGNFLKEKTYFLQRVTSTQILVRVWGWGRYTKFEVIQTNFKWVINLTGPVVFGSDMRPVGSLTGYPAGQPRYLTPGDEDLMEFWKTELDSVSTRWLQHQCSCWHPVTCITPSVSTLSSSRQPPIVNMLCSLQVLSRTCLVCLVYRCCVIPSTGYRGHIIHDPSVYTSSNPRVCVCVCVCVFVCERVNECNTWE